MNRSVRRKQRVLDAITHRTPDRAPKSYLAVEEADRRLRRYLGVETERELLDTLGCDCYFLSVRDVSQNESTDAIRTDLPPIRDGYRRICPFGITYRRSVGRWKFAADEAVGHPLSNVRSVREVLEYPMPDTALFDLDLLLAECEANADRAVIGGFWSAIFGNAYRIMGYERFLLEMALNSEITKTLVNRLTDFYLTLNDRLFSVLKGKLDIYFIGNDFGTQNGPMFGREMWLEHFFEPYKKLVVLAKSYGLYTMAHSCGSIAQILPDLIDAGVDIIDPVQTSAAGMDPDSLKADFGRKLAFHGAINTQSILPNRTIDEVRMHVRKQIAALGSNGGYIVAPCNNIQADTPPENVVAMYETVG